MKRLIAVTVSSLTLASTAQAAPLNVRREANQAERAWRVEWNQNPFNLRARMRPGLPECGARQGAWRCTVGLVLEGGACAGPVVVRDGVAGRVRAVRCVA